MVSHYDFITEKIMSKKIKIALTHFFLKMIWLCIEIYLMLCVTRRHSIIQMVSNYDYIKETQNFFVLLENYIYCDGISMEWKLIKSYRNGVHSIWMGMRERNKKIIMYAWNSCSFSPYTHNYISVIIKMLGQ